MTPPLQCISCFAELSNFHLYRKSCGGCNYVVYPTEGSIIIGGVHVWIYYEFETLILTLSNVKTQYSFHELNINYWQDIVTQIKFILSFT